MCIEELHLTTNQKNLLLNGISSFHSLNPALKTAESIANLIYEKKLMLHDLSLDVIRARQLQQKIHHSDSNTTTLSSLQIKGNIFIKHYKISLTLGVIVIDNIII